MRILLVEDNRDILANMADYLQIKGYTVDCAQDGLPFQLGDVLAQECFEKLVD